VILAITAVSVLMTVKLCVVVWAAVSLAVTVKVFEPTASDKHRAEPAARLGGCELLIGVQMRGESAGRYRATLGSDRDVAVVQVAVEVGDAEAQGGRVRRGVICHDVRHGRQVELRGDGSPVTEAR